MPVFPVLRGPRRWPSRLWRRSSGCGSARRWCMSTTATCSRRTASPGPAPPAPTWRACSAARPWPARRPADGRGARRPHPAWPLRAPGAVGPRRRRAAGDRGGGGRLRAARRAQSTRQPPPTDAGADTITPGAAITQPALPVLQPAVMPMPQPGPAAPVMPANNALLPQGNGQGPRRVTSFAAKAQQSRLAPAAGASLRPLQPAAHRLAQAPPPASRGRS